ncbi:pentapeptide repeat-containing protein [Streptomyces sp. NPDC091217]|uniref:pentapeptide repeat-containing protein n=1 Tax=Streptomyces sp. NPDC091217 TaxID=3365975 RepID=UPI00380608BF
MAAVAFSVFIMLLWQGPWWIDEGHFSTVTPGRAALVTGFRTSMVALGAGAVAGIGLFYTDRTLRQTRIRDREQARLAIEGQITDRYIKSVGLLASSDPTEQLGGIYALERIMRDSPKDHMPVTEVLASFVRRHAILTVEDHIEEMASTGHRVADPVQAAMTVLSRRPVRNEPYPLTLRRVDLHGAILDDGNLRRFRLREAHLEHADLRRVHLEGAGLQGAYLQGAHLREGHLENADLSGARLRGARLVDARLHGTTLYGADLTEAIGVTVEQILTARIDGTTSLPSEISCHPLVQELVETDRGHSPE